MKMQVFDSPMCCSTGACGQSSVDPKLMQFSADLAWLTERGIEIERFSFSQQAAVFADTPVVSEMLEREGTECLPVLVSDGMVLSKGQYPTRQMLAGFAGLPSAESIFSEGVRELVAIGASIVSNCEMCFRYHFNEARKLGVSKHDIRLAIEMAQKVKESPARSISELAKKHLGDPAINISPCCCNSSVDELSTDSDSDIRSCC